VLRGILVFLLLFFIHAVLNKAGLDFFVLILFGLAETLVDIEK
jgi:hypothetical protein